MIHSTLLAIFLLAADSGLPGNDGFMFDQRYVPLMKKSEALLVSDPKALNDHKRNIVAMKDILKKLRTQDHPAVKQAYLDVAAFEAKVNAGAPAAAPAADPGALTGTAAFKLKRAQDTFNEFNGRLEKATVEDFAALGAQKDRYFKDGAKQVRDLVGEIAQKDHPSVQKLLADVAAYDQRVDEKQTAAEKQRADLAAKNAAEASDVGSQLEELNTYFKQGSFSAKLEPPYTETRVREWIENLQQWDAAKAKGTATLDALAKDHPNYASDPRMKSLRWWFTDPMGLDAALKSGIGATAETWKDGSSSGSGELAWRVKRALDYGKPGAVKDRVFSDDQEQEQLLRYLAEGVEAANALVMFKRDYRKVDVTQELKTLADVKAIEDKVGGRAKALIEKARLPRAESTDAGLLARATPIVKDCGAGKVERMVINYGLHHKTERKSSSRDEGRYIRITSWNEVWDEYQVTTAEQDGADYRLVSYSIKNRTVGPAWTVTNRWYCSDRIVSGKILKANISK